MAIVNGLLTNLLNGTVGGLLIGTAPPVPFPSSIPNLFSRYRSDQVTLTSGNVSTWSDISGNSHNVTQATNANRPTYTLTVNGTTVVSFSGSQFLSAASAITNSNKDITILAVIRTSSAKSSSTYNGDAPITVLGDATGGVVAGFGVGGGFTDARIFNGGALGGFTEIKGSSVVVNNGNAHSIGMTMSHVTSPITVYADNTNDGSSATAGISNWEYDSIGRGFDTHDNFVGDIGEILVYSRILTSTELGQLEAYFKSFWGTP